MTDNRSGELSNEAAKIVKEQVLAIQSTDGDSLSWLPADFGEQIIRIAWKHQFDIDKAVFRRDLHKYLDSTTIEND